MFEQHFHLKENPFAAGHQPRFVYPSREHQEAIAHLRYGVENHEPFVLITGEVGTGKTTAVFNALNQLSQRASVALITNSALNRVELLEEICLRFGMQIDGVLSKPQLLAQLERHLQAVHARGDRSVLIVDEAQNLSRDLLEEIRLLSNLESQGDSMLQIFLVGQPELSTRLLQPELRQLRQRITVRYRLRPLDGEETEHYIHHRISVAGGNAWQIFPAVSCRVVFDLTGGVPREINTVASQALLNAFVEDAPHVEPRHVQSVASEMGFESVVGVQDQDEPEPEGETPSGESSPPAPSAEPDATLAEREPPVEPPVEAPTEGSTEAVQQPAPEPLDEWEPATTLESDDSLASYEGLGVEEGQAEAEPIEPTPGDAGMPPDAKSDDLGIEAIGDDLPAERVQALQARSVATAEAPSAPLGITRLQDVAEEPPPAAVGASSAATASAPPPTPPACEPQVAPVAVSAPPAPVAPWMEPDSAVPWVEPSLGPSKSRPKPDLLAALRTELQQKYEASEPAAPAPADPMAAATMLANLEHSTAKAASEREAVVPAVDYLPARLRARLESMEREQARPRRKLDGYAVAWIALIGVAIVVAFIVWARLRPSASPTPAQHSGAAVLEPPAPTAPAASEKTSGKDASAGGAKPTAASPTGAPPAAPSRAAVSTTRPATAPAQTTTPPDQKPTTSAPAARSYGIQVAVFQTQEKAMEAQTSLSRLAGRSGRVLHTEGDTWYRVVIGEFASADSAARAGDAIVQHGWVDDYLVVPITPATAAVAPTPR